MKDIFYKMHSFGVLQWWRLYKFDTPPLEGLTITCPDISPIGNT